MARKALLGAANLAPQGVSSHIPGAATAQQNQARKILLDYLTETGTDTKALRGALTDEDIANLPLSAGQKTGDPALLALETGLARSDEKFRRALEEGGKESLSIMRDMVLMLRGTGDPNLIRVAAQIRDEAISTALTSRLEAARQRALQSAGDISADTPAAREALSVQVFEAIDLALKDARAVENALWGRVPRDVQVNDAPLREAFDFLDSDRLVGESYQLPAKVRDFVLHNLDELGESGLDSANISVGEVLKFRTEMLNAARDATAGANPDRSAARIYNTMADAALRALDDEAVSADLSEPLEAARAYSRAVNDTFTRSFAGVYLRKNHSGGYTRSPESLLRFATATGQDATNLNMRDLDAAMDFVARRSEVVAAREGGELPLRSSDEVAADMNLVMDAQERALRLAAAEAIDPTDGLPKKGRLEAFKTKYSSTLERFPQVVKTIDQAIEDQAKLLRLTGRTREAEKVIRNKAVLYKITGSENPSDAIRSVINGYSPKAHIGQLVRSAKGFGPEAEEALVASIFDYAIQRATNTATGGVDLTKLRTALTQPLRPNQPSLVSIMRDADLGDPAVYEQLERLFTRADEITSALKAGDVAAQAFDDPSASFDFILRTTGAALGSAASGMMHGGSGASLIVTGKRRGRRGLRPA